MGAGKFDFPARGRLVRVGAGAGETFRFSSVLTLLDLAGFREQKHKGQRLLVCSWAQLRGSALLHGLPPFAPNYLILLPECQVNRPSIAIRQLAELVAKAGLTFYIFYAILEALP